MSGYTERFEKDAEQFYHDTGMMAPGKDQPAAMCGHTYEERLAAWEIWRAVSISPTEDDLERLMDELENYAPIPRHIEHPARQRLRDLFSQKEVSK